MSKVRVVNFEPTSKGENTHLYTIENNSGASVTLCDLGASVVSIKVPDKNGSIRDVVLGYEHIDGYEFDGTYFGATVGRCCGRIAYGKFTLNGEDYQLPVNNGSNHLHGGFNSFSRKVWLAVVDDKVPNTVLFMLDSPDGDEGYPGNMKVFVRYTFDDENVLTIKWSAVSDKDTICNLTNHSYFNLNGHKSGKVTENHKLKINANFFIPINSNLNPTGEITPVKNTSFDFTEPKLIGNGIDRKNEQIGFANGIFRSVFMWVLPEAWIDTCKITYQLSDTDSAAVKLQVCIGLADGVRPPFRLTVKADQQESSFCIASCPESNHIDFEAHLLIEKIQRWDIDSPNLTVFHLTLERGRKV